MRMGKHWSENNIDSQTRERIDKIITGEYDENIKNRVREKAMHFANISSFRGSYVLLDFTAYRADFSMRHNEIISRVYNKYKSKGLEVYQISFDSDSHFWKNVSVELPWTTVYDPQSVYSSLLKSYNVRELPTAYIIDKEGNLIKRIEDFDKLDQYIGELL